MSRDPGPVTGSDAPVLVASGCGGTGRELDALGGLDGIGGFVTRTITLDARDGGPRPRVVESPSGFRYAVGLQNPGIDGFLALELPWLVSRGIRVAVSISAASLGEYADLGRRLGRSPGVAAIELNLVPPDAAGAGLFDAREPFQAARVVGAVRRDLPAGVQLWAKPSADPGRLAETARALAEAGADAVVLVNGLPALMPDGRPAGLAGPAIGPLALRCVHDVASQVPDLPVIAAGGVVDADDVRALLDVGAVAVQVGSALLHDPTAAARAAATLRGDA
ncbi:nitronate monooxygenase [Nocardioides donggukensis]|uniref:Nitronate monooxygenase n=1 Tax=Nocardioides donggukensis TaxID=2774019 RepID=A0A927K652_9ACTN|nr:nitronate monooxygenase [Nocardioides donggukensis]MBD8869738.1 nitronate monooxygenase [Nocardioides donggukensis]